MQILRALFPHITCMSEREGCQVTIWPSDSLCHTNMSTSDTGCCLYFLEVTVFIWEINSKQRPRQWHVLFSVRIHWRQMSWIWGKEGNIKWQALARYSLDLNDHVIRQYLKHRWLSFFPFKIMPYKVKDLFKWITLSLLSRFHVLKDTIQPILDFYGWRFLFAGLWMFSRHSTLRIFFL